jgi:8-oxo-dGTP pyrophosphatase MutT (NUDIX family)
MKGIGKSFLNGWGGGTEDHETPLSGVTRELEEETKGDRERGIIVNPYDLEKVAIMSFHNFKKDRTPFTCKVHVYSAKKWDGEIISTSDIADPKRYRIDKLPFNCLMPADRFWLPLALCGEKIIGEAWYGLEQKTLTREPEIQVVEFFPKE